MQVKRFCPYQSKKLGVYPMPPHPIPWHSWFRRHPALSNIRKQWEAHYFLTMIVLLFPPRAFCNNLVKTESLKGIRTFFPSDCSARALITFPRLDKLMLIPAPSFKRSPVAPVESTLSLEYKLTINYQQSRQKLGTFLEKKVF